MDRLRGFQGADVQARNLSIAEQPETLLLSSSKRQGLSVPRNWLCFRDSRSDKSNNAGSHIPFSKSSILSDVVVICSSGKLRKSTFGRCRLSVFSKLKILLVVSFVAL